MDLLDGLLWFSGRESDTAMKNERATSHKPRIEIAPGIFVVADKRAGQSWIQAWGVLNTALKRCKTNDQITGDASSDYDQNHQPRRY